MGNNFMHMATDRKLLIFGSGAQEQSVQQQLSMFNKETIGLQNRDIKIILIKKDDLLHKKYAVKEGIFMVVLIGKDGTEKFRTVELLLPQKLFAIIDAMPMRQAEMKNNRQSK